MRPQRVLVTGCARSGTGYASALLSRLGVPCGHERLFNPLTIWSAGGQSWKRAPAWPEGTPAESSWLAAPFLDALPAGTLVLHQVRHPLAVVRSNLRIQFFHVHSSYLDFARHWLPTLTRGTALERAVSYWVGWNQIAEHAADHPRLRYLRYRLEQIDEDFVLSLLGELGLEVDRARVRAALAEVPRDTNTRSTRFFDDGVQLTDLPAGALRSELDLKARQYGFHEPFGSTWRMAMPDSVRLF